MNDRNIDNWAGLHISGLLLAALLYVHLFSVHYANDVMITGYTFETVSQRMSNGAYSYSLLALLVVALFHGLVGLYRFIDDLGMCGFRTLKTISLVLKCSGALGLYYGIRIFIAFT